MKYGLVGVGGGPSSFGGSINLSLVEMGKVCPWKKSGRKNKWRRSPSFPIKNFFFITSPFPELQRRKKSSFFIPGCCCDRCGEIKWFQNEKKTLYGRREGGGNTKNTKNFDISLFFGGDPFLFWCLLSCIWLFFFVSWMCAGVSFFLAVPFLGLGANVAFFIWQKGLFRVVPCLLFSLSLFLCSDALLSRFQPKDNVPPAV